jgi:hypothetical protein
MSDTDRAERATAAAAAVSSGDLEQPTIRTSSPAPEVHQQPGERQQ